MSARLASSNSSSSSLRISSRRAAGFLELEVGGGLAHPAFEIADVGAQIMPDEVRALFVAGLDQHPAAPASLSASRIATSLPEFE